ncbi:MAG: hypothetical protein E7K04_05230 [Helicobacter sp.]|nr:hypothetical protein [Helicobacter sp.]
MFGIGIFELVIILAVAIIFLGDKFPQMLIAILKIVRNISQSVSETKQKLEDELSITEMKANVTQSILPIEKKQEDLVDLTDLAEPKNPQELFAEFKKPKSAIKEAESKIKESKDI